MQLSVKGARTVAGPLCARRAGRARVLRVQNVFFFGKQRDAAKNSSGSVPRQAAAAVEAPPAPATTIHPRKAVQAVPPKDRPTVELVMVLTNLARQPGASLASQLSEHELSLVTTSATCDAMFGAALDSYSEDFESSGDGMASPIADIRAAAEQLAAEVRGNSIATDWNPAQSPGSSSFSNTSASRAAQPGPHTLEQLMAQSDYDQLAGSTAARDANSSIMARVHSLQSQIKQAAAAASKGAGAGSKEAPGGVASARKQQRRAGGGAASDDEDGSSYGDGAAMPTLPRLGAAAAGLPGFSSMAAGGRARAAAAPAYPTYTDPASTWLVADSADGRVRHIVIRAPEALAAAVAGARAAADTTTFESYSMGAKINKGLYQEANALYNRFMPLVLDHLEEAGPQAQVMLSGAGLGGSLAALLLLMFVARGMRATAFAPVHTLNAPAVLCEVPDFKAWCSKDGCSLQDMDGMLEDLLHRGILSQLGLPLDAVRNIYHQQEAAESAVQAVTPTGLRAVAASSSEKLSSMVQHLDTAALQQSPYVPDLLKSWLKQEAAGVHSGYQRLHILNPVGKMLLWVR